MRTPTNEGLTPDIVDTANSRAGGSERRCVLTGDTGERDSLIRLAVSPDGAVLADPLAKAPGRGAWIGVDKHALEAALGSGDLKRALARAFKDGKIAIADGLPDQVEAGLRKALLDRLGLEMRSGKLILGAERIAEQARSGRVAWLGHAADAKEDGTKRLDQAYRVGLDAEGSGLRGERLPLDRAALSVALGRDNVVHLALADRRSAERVTIPLGRLKTFLGAADAAGQGSDATSTAAATH